MFLDIVIVGGGPAGIAAAYMLSKLKVKSMLITSELGGCLNHVLIRDPAKIETIRRMLHAIDEKYCKVIRGVNVKDINYDTGICVIKADTEYKAWTCIVASSFNFIYPPIKAENVLKMSIVEVEKYPGSSKVLIVGFDRHDIAREIEVVRAYFKNSIVEGKVYSEIEDLERYKSIHDYLILAPRISASELLFKLGVKNVYSDGTTNIKNVFIAGYAATGILDVYSSIGSGITAAYNACKHVLWIKSRIREYHGMEVDYVENLLSKIHFKTVKSLGELVKVKSARGKFILGLHATWSPLGSLMLPAYAYIQDRGIDVYIMPVTIHTFQRICNMENIVLEGIPATLYYVDGSLKGFRQGVVPLELLLRDIGEIFGLEI